MSAPTPVSEAYVSCVGATMTINPSGTPLVLKVIEGGVTLSQGVDEMTNTGSGGWYEDVGTVKSGKGTLTCAYVSGLALPFTPGIIYDCEIKNGSSPDITGNFRFNDMELPLLNIKDGLKYKFAIQSQGALTIA